MIDVQRPAVRRLAIAVAAFAWGALLLQLWLTLRLTQANGDSIGWGLVVYFGFFTILTNLLAASTLTVPLVDPQGRAGRCFARAPVVTSVTAAIVSVGLSYFFLLRHVWEPQGWQFIADIALHYAMPVLFFVYWLIAVPPTQVRWRDLPAWTIFPLAYLAYALVRGMWIGSYPYYFIDVGAIGYRQTFVNALGILALFLTVGACLIMIARARGRLNRRAE